MRRHALSAGVPIAAVAAVARHARASRPLRIAPHEGHAARTELRALQRGAARTADRHRFGADEDQVELLPVLEALAPVRVKELAVHAVERIVELDSEKLQLIVALLSGLPGEVVKGGLPVGTARNRLRPELVVHRLRNVPHHVVQDLRRGGLLVERVFERLGEIGVRELVHGRAVVRRRDVVVVRRVGERRHQHADVVRERVDAEVARTGDDLHQAVEAIDLLRRVRRPVHVAARPLSRAAAIIDGQAVEVAGEGGAEDLDAVAVAPAEVRQEHELARRLQVLLVAGEHENVAVSAVLGPEHVADVPDPLLLQVAAAVAVHVRHEPGFRRPVEARVVAEHGGAAVERVDGLAVELLDAAFARRKGELELLVAAELQNRRTAADQVLKRTGRALVDLARKIVLLVVRQPRRHDVDDLAALLDAHPGGDVKRKLLSVQRIAVDATGALAQLLRGDQPAVLLLRTVRRGVVEERLPPAGRRAAVVGVAEVIGTERVAALEAVHHAVGLVLQHLAAVLHVDFGVVDVPEHRQLGDVRQVDGDVEVAERLLGRRIVLIREAERRNVRRDGDDAVLDARAGRIPVVLLRIDRRGLVQPAADAPRRPPGADNHVAGEVGRIALVLHAAERERDRAAQRAGSVRERLERELPRDALVLLDGVAVLVELGGLVVARQFLRDAGLGLDHLLVLEVEGDDHRHRLRRRDAERDRSVVAVEVVPERPHGEGADAPLQVVVEHTRLLDDVHQPRVGRDRRERLLSREVVALHGGVDAVRRREPGVGDEKRVRKRGRVARIVHRGAVADVAAERRERTRAGDEIEVGERDERDVARLVENRVELVRVADVEVAETAVAEQRRHVDALARSGRAAVAGREAVQVEAVRHVHGAERIAAELVGEVRPFRRPRPTRSEAHLVDDRRRQVGEGLERQHRYGLLRADRAERREDAVDPMVAGGAELAAARARVDVHGGVRPDPGIRIVIDALDQQGGAVLVALVVPDHPLERAVPVNAVDCVRERGLQQIPRGDLTVELARGHAALAHVDGETDGRDQHERRHAEHDQECAASFHHSPLSASVRRKKFGR